MTINSGLMSSLLEMLGAIEQESFAEECKDLLDYIHSDIAEKSLPVEYIQGFTHSIEILAKSFLSTEKYKQLISNKKT